MKKNIIIGSRGSILALAQANLVKNRLQENYPNLIFEIKKNKLEILVYSFLF